MRIVGAPLTTIKCNQLSPPSLVLHSPLGVGAPLTTIKCNQLSPPSLVLHSPLGVGELQLCPLFDVCLPTSSCVYLLSFRLSWWYLVRCLFVVRRDGRERWPHHFSLHRTTIETAVIHKLDSEVLRMQKLRTPLVGAKSCQRFPLFKPGVGI